MPNLGGFAVLDVAIGLATLFFLLSTALSALNEGLSNVLGWRAKTLEDALRNLVGDKKVKEGLKTWLGRVDPPADPKYATENQLRQQPLGSLADEGARPRPRLQGAPARPAVVSPAEGVLARSRRDDRRGRAVEGRRVRQVPVGADRRRDSQALVTAAGELPEGQLRDIVQKAARNSHATLDGFRAQVEHLFDDSMQRASGWYKRKVQVVLARARDDRRGGTERRHRARNDVAA